jgi:hypothetical protein
MLQATGLPAPCPGQPRSQMWSGNRGRSCGPATVVRQCWSGNRESGNLFGRGEPSRRHAGSGRCRVHTPHFEPRRYSLSPVLRAQGVRSGLEVAGARSGMAAAWVGRITAAGWGGEESRRPGGVGRNHEEMEEFGEGAIRRRGSVTGVPEGRWQDANAREP